MKRTPFLIFPWQRPFLPALKTAVLDQDGHCLIIVPHNRPRRYLYRLYAQAGEARLLPRVITLTETITLWRTAVFGPLHIASPLDRAALLHQCVLRLSRDDATLAGRFAHMGMPAFLPWGLRLAVLLEEIFSQGMTPEDLRHAEMEASPAAAALLGALGRIGTAYRENLKSRSWTTPGLDALAVAGMTEEIPDILMPAEKKNVLAAGFHVLTHTEDSMLRTLWQAGARICLHTDPALARGGSVHWACAEHISWLQRWRAQASLAVDAENTGNDSPRYSFFAGYDCHSQLKAMREMLTHHQTDERSSTAIVLTGNGLLLPVLHHLPDKDVNISMGYPLTRSPLYHLIESILHMQLRRSREGLYYWRDLLQTLRHPYLRRLHLLDGQGQQWFLHSALRHLERQIRFGSRYVNLTELIDVCMEHIDEPVRQMFLHCLDIVAHRPGQAGTPADMADCLYGLCDLLLSFGGEIWQFSPLDAEAVYRLMRTVIPALRSTLLAANAFPMAELCSIVKETLAQERIPFEADPLTGLQVLGMLETRLLHFDRVLIMDATDDSLPGNAAQDPLLPDSLRVLLDLPDARHRERTVAHTLYRLCMGAREVHFFWQEGVSRSTLFDGKKSRSRFVEELLWQQEQQRSAILEPGQGPLRSASCTVNTVASTAKTLIRTPQIDKAMQALLHRPLSASLLDTYLQCPLSFAWRYLLRLDTPQEVCEGDDPAGVGDCLHETLRLLYEPWLRRQVQRNDISMSQVRACLEQALESVNARRPLPAAACLMLESAAPPRLRRFLEAQPEITFILALEEEIKAELYLAGQKYVFIGRMDRLDRRDGLLHVLDYKSGNLKKADPSLWTDTAFFDDIPAACTADNPERLGGLLEELRQRLPSVQLPCYISMLTAQRIGTVGDAALVDLRATGREVPLFGGLADQDLEQACTYCDLALTLVLRHMQNSPVWTARPDKHCRWCAYTSVCMS